ncbi:MAG: CBS domain-containing protein [Flavobacteriaceae bacterium]|jgi:CBS domain-containing protein|nr:CBS domain-containing protein [Flavobacteriaceae bacterium]MDG2289600.1 CBS domain-containing protein [Flavobacteriaceae bacterium]
MKKRESVRHIMADEPVVLHLNDGLGQAEKLFKKHRVRHLPVVSGAKIVGILSMTDLARISFVDSYDPHDFTIDTSVYSVFTLEQIMVRKPKCIPDTATIKEVAEIFLDADFHALPVVDKKDNLLGIVTTTDLIKYLLEQY